MPDQATRPGAQRLAKFGNGDPPGMETHPVWCTTMLLTASVKMQKWVHNCSAGRSQMDIHIRKYQSGVGF